MEQLLELMQGGTNITLSIKSSDLMYFGRYLIETAREEAKSAIKNGDDNPLLNVAETMRWLKLKNRTTLWRWEKRGYLLPVRTGGKVAYKHSDIQRIVESKKK